MLTDVSLTDEQFDRTRRLARQFAGIALFERHREVLARRCRRLGIVTSDSYAAFLCAAEGGDPAAAGQLLDLVTTRYTGFFRHLRHFETAARIARRAIALRGCARLWCAATASGEEACSLAMAVIEQSDAENPPFEILATDISERALAIAKAGLYPERAVEAVGVERRARFFTLDSGSGQLQIAPRVQGHIEYQQLNLVQEAWPVRGPFDVIFCRNVLMYLETGARRVILERMAPLLTPEGVLMLDPAEHPGPAGHLFASGADGIYPLRRPDCPPVPPRAAGAAGVPGRLDGVENVNSVAGTQNAALPMRSRADGGLQEDRRAIFNRARSPRS